MKDLLDVWPLENDKLICMLVLNVLPICLLVFGLMKIELSRLGPRLLRAARIELLLESGRLLLADVDVDAHTGVIRSSLREWKAVWWDETLLDDGERVVDDDEVVEEEDEEEAEEAEDTVDDEESESVPVIPVAGIVTAIGTTETTGRCDGGSGGGGGSGVGSGGGCARTMPLSRTGGASNVNVAEPATVAADLSLSNLVVSMRNGSLKSNLAEESGLAERFCSQPGFCGAQFGHITLLTLFLSYLFPLHTFIDAQCVFSYLTFGLNVLFYFTFVHGLFFQTFFFLL